MVLPILLVVLPISHICTAAYRLQALEPPPEPKPEPESKANPLSKVVHQLQESLNMVCPTCEAPVDPSPDGCIAIYKGSMRGCPSGCDAFCWLCREVCGKDAHPHCGRVHGDFFPPRHIIAQWERRYRWRRVQDVLWHALIAGGMERDAALQVIQPNLQSHGLWPFPATEPTIGGVGEVEPANSLDAAFAAARRGDAGAVQAMLVIEPAFIDAVDARGMTMLMVAAHAGHGEVVAVLLERGARVEQQDERRRTALHMAVEMGQAEISRVLLEAWPEGETLNLLEMRMNVKTATILAQVSKEKQISLCGISSNQTTADFRRQRLGVAEGILIAASLELRGSLTEVHASGKRWIGASVYPLLGQTV